MGTRTISTIYLRGDESAAHITRHKGDRSSNWANVPKNRHAKMGKAKQINKWTHAYEVMNGYGSSLDYAIGGGAMSDEDMLSKLGAIKDPLLAMFE